MTEHLESEHLESFPNVNRSGDRTSVEQPDRSVTVELPSDIATAIYQCSRQSGQTQAQVITEMLRSALRLDQNSEAEQIPDSDTRADMTTPLLEQVQHLTDRLIKLESLVPKLEALEGKLLAF
jgi:hypothetical protein